MPRKLVVCCDGTWNVPDELRHGVAAPTNVAKLAVALVSDPDPNDGQLFYYEAGVGTSADERLIGGAFGYGLSQNIRNGYRFLAENYRDGDQVFLFGFSRGAYTARSLAGLVRNCGILRPDHADRVDEAFAFYRDRTSQTHPSAIASVIFRRMYSWPESKIYFVGVWDTVGALGIPDDLPGWEEVSKVLTGWEQLWGFHDTQLSKDVAYAYHALAIDEQRAAFKPTLWTQDDQADHQELEQVWFAGVHSEIGGGTKDPSLSDIALTWMVERAVQAGVKILPGQPAAGSPDLEIPPVAPDYAAKIVDSRSGVWELIHPYHRLRELAVGDAPAQSIATSAERRYDERIDGYSPPGLKDYLDALPRLMPVVEGRPRPA